MIKNTLGTLAPELFLFPCRPQCANALKGKKRDPTLGVQANSVSRDAESNKRVEAACLLHVFQRNLALAEHHLSKSFEITSLLFEQCQRGCGSLLESSAYGKGNCDVEENALLTEKVTALELSSKQLERELQNANNRRTEKEIEM